MRTLILQFVDPAANPPLPVFSHDLGVLGARLQAAGSTCHLLALPGYRPSVLRRAVIEHRPQYVLAELTPFSVAAARRSIVDIAERFALPVVALGPYATCLPDSAISMPGVQAVLIGEHHTTALGLLEALDSGEDVTSDGGVPGAWTHGPEGLVKGPPAPLATDLDSLPFPDRGLFGYQQIVQRTREARFQVGRGCPRWCAYCTNDWYLALYAEQGGYVRRRSVGNVLEEVAQVVSRHDGVQTVVFEDHDFALDVDWLAEFAASYPRRCAVGCRCHVRLDAVTPEVVGLLAAGMCRAVRTHVGSGSRFIREEILSLPASNEQILRACRLLRDAGIRVSADAFVGTPYESEITVEETLDLLRAADVDEVRPKVFFPVPGSRAAELCAEAGWISGRGEENYWAQRSVLDMPSLPARQINAVARRFSSFLGGEGTSRLQKLLRKFRGRRQVGRARRRRPR